MSSVAGGKKAKKANNKKDLAKKNSKVDSRYNDQDAESIVQKVEDESAAIIDQEVNVEVPQVEVPDVQDVVADAVEAVDAVLSDDLPPVEDGEVSPNDLGIEDEMVTKQTLGTNLVDQVDDQQSFAATVKQNVKDDEFDDMKKNIQENPDKYSEGNVVKNEPSEEEDLGFMDEEIQPK